MHGQKTEERGISLEALGPGFRPDSYHQLLLRRTGQRCELRVDGVLVADDLELPPEAGRVGLFTRRAAAAFDGIAVTYLPSPLRPANYQVGDVAGAAERGRNI